MTHAALRALLTEPDDAWRHVRVGDLRAILEELDALRAAVALALTHMEAADDLLDDLCEPCSADDDYAAARRALSAARGLRSHG